ncbi:MAG TPA: hypothetical protein PKD90_08885 [Phnomibacter sp.]|nr:hypothetical protein [Phnomibacter sp.]
MKKWMLATTLALTTATLWAYTPENEKEKTKAKEKAVSATYTATQNLIIQFGEITNVTWSNAMSNMMRADFMIDNESISAFFDSNGEFVASTRSISRQQLPIKLRLKVDAKLTMANITHMFELSSPQEHAYYFEVEEDGKKKVWKGYDYGVLERYRPGLGTKF